MIIAPSILSANWINMAKELQMCLDLGIRQIHIDVMDGNFVEPITFGAKFIADMRTYSNDLFFDTHIMVNNPEKYIVPMIEAGSNALTFHYEATNFSLRLCNYIKTHYPHIQAGIAINPQTPVEVLLPILKNIDIVLLMGVEPGFGGQSFIPYTRKKIEALMNIKQQNNYSYLISIDGGVNSNNAKELVDLGADCLVMGSAFFSEQNKQALLERIQNNHR